MSWPSGFRVGVATAGFAIEGGYNGDGHPANNWAGWEAASRVERSGAALRFWDRPGPLLDEAAALGCNSFRMSVEWARCQPRPGEVDRDALAGYRTLLEQCHERSLRPVVSLHHFTHPGWLGERFWLDLASPERFRDWCTTAVDALGDLCDDWVTINEANTYALCSYVTGTYPPGERGATGFAIRSIDHLVAAHALAYGAIKARRPDADVTTTLGAFSAYELDRLIVDLLLHRSRGVSRRELHEHLVERRRQWYDALPAASVGDRLVRHFTKSGIPLDQAFPRAQAAIEEAGRPLDAVDIAFHDPFSSHLLGRRRRIPWDPTVRPEILLPYCLAASEPGLPLRIVANGTVLVKENAAALRELIGAGAPITGYWHWTLADAYEWGSYEPRFGILGVDRSDPDSPRVMADGRLGDDSAAAFRAALAGEGTP